ncbi:hypothetical protein AMTRI_Chr01g126460 [Amborella trichopoda]
MKALFALRSKCKKEATLCWDVRRQFFRNIVQPTVLYGCAVWGPRLEDKYWKKIEEARKQLLSEEFKIKQQTQYDIMLLEAELMSLEFEAIWAKISHKVIYEHMHA